MSQNNINLTVPKDYEQKDILLKIEKKKVTEPKIEKFRSFCL